MIKDFDRVFPVRYDVGQRFVRAIPGYRACRENGMILIETPDEVVCIVINVELQVHRFVNRVMELDRILVWVAAIWRKLIERFVDIRDARARTPGYRFLLTALLPALSQTVRRT